jgi:hypothetical protein
MNYCEVELNISIIRHSSLILQLKWPANGEMLWPSGNQTKQATQISKG